MSLEISVRTPDGKTEGKVSLPAELFDVEPNIHLMHQVVIAQLAAARQGTHSTKRRGEVSGGGKKPFRQKGTGRARQASSRARSTPAAASYTARSRVTTASAPQEDDRRRTARCAVGSGATTGSTRSRNS